MTIASFNILWIGLAMVAIAIVVLIVKRPQMPRSTAVLMIIGMLTFVLAAAGVTLKLPSKSDIAVLVDLSPSTRTAGFRDRAAAESRVKQLLGDLDHRAIVYFGENADRTVYGPPMDADAVVLFSDGRFELPPTAPPTYVIVDSMLEQAQDASITRLEPRDEDAIDVGTRNNGPARELQVTAAKSGPTTIASGAQFQTIAIDPAPAQQAPLTARLSSSDPWPENDVLTLRLPPPRRVRRWWVGAKLDGMAEDWQILAPADLPSDASSYLTAGVIMLNNISADSLSSIQQTRLSQFVRELGGGMAILGGDHAFGSGGYDGSSVEALSPLASSPSVLQREWVILVDSSGSMAAATPDGTTRWQRASAAVAGILSRLPPNDIVNVGDFARDLRFWSPPERATELSRRPFPPAAIAPQGPTNLAVILQTIASKLDRASRIEIILVSDGDATIDKPEDLAQSFRDVSARVHLMATGTSARESVQRTIALTGGIFVPQPDPKLWDDSIKQVLRGTLKDRLVTFGVDIEFAGDLASLTNRKSTLWNRVWLKENATLLASGDDAGTHAPLAARWRSGAGQVGAMAFPTNAAEAEKLASLVAKPARDTKFKASWTGGPSVVVTVEAAENDRPINSAQITLSVGDESDPTRNATMTKLNQIAPGRYEASIPAPRIASLASLRTGNELIDRFAIAARYAPEFEAIGNDHDAMNELAKRTGGAVIASAQTTPIQVASATRAMQLTSPLAAAGATMIALGLVIWKARRHAA